MTSTASPDNHIYDQETLDWFDYPDLELGGVLMTTINEMLLQSHDGVIRVFPAMPKAWPDGAVRDLASGDDIQLSPENLNVRFPSRSTGRYLVYRKDVPANAPQPPAPKQAANGPKEWRGRRIGIPRQF